MSNQDNINSFLDSMDEAPADQFTAAENSFASPVGNPQQAPYTPAAVWPGDQQNEPVPQATQAPTAPAVNTGAQQSMLDPFEQALKGNSYRVCRQQ